MKRFKKSKVAGIMMISALLAAGCSANSTSSSSSASTSANSSQTAAAVSSSGAASAAAVKLASVDISKQTGFDDNDSLTTWDAGSSTAITLNSTSATVTGSGASASGGVVTITAAGTYVVSGTLTNGQLVVNAPEDAEVHIVLNGAKITNASGPAFYIQQSDKTIVTLQEGTDNTLADGATYSDTSEEAPTAAFYSKSDLTINGTGSLNVEGNAKDGITSKDDLKIMSGTINVKAADDGIIGRDLVAVKEGTITVDAGGDGMKSTNDSEDDKGYVAIAGGTFDITSVNDGIQAASSLYIAGGTYDIVTGGGSANSTKTHEDQKMGGFRGQAPSDGTAPSQSSDTAAAASSADSSASSSSSSTSSTEETESTSAKALKAAGDIAIMDGKFTIDAADDALHSSADAAIMGGQFTLSSGDDGVHADNGLSISNGTIDVVKSYEGIEGSDIQISGGTIHVTTTDDGVNVGGGNDNSSAAAPGGGGDAFGTTDGTLAISGGYLVVDAQGDGLDSNGSMTMTGGTAIVNGPTDSGNGPLDYNGTFEQSGGTLIAAGSSGMAQAPSEDSTQLAIQMTFPDTLEAGTLVTLTDSTGKTVAAFAPSKTFSSIVISSPDLKSGENYTISTGGTSTGTAADGLYKDGSTSGSTKVVTFAMGDKVTYVNESGVTTQPSSFGGGGQGGGRHGMPGTQDGQDPAGTGTGTGTGTEVNG
ncbi:carbohydrate-binding domain-containing protein [Paenibacillus pinistramenti]|uniref:carbohydrate-binding domain-containing protein n=1 Tax=Paenibacillus pinistramenti TaxID=1768003 RepID=UPI0011085884|nr:carbohydrate-binding domain-containing protein [Paenibacillus pinistramenti]